MREDVVPGNFDIRGVIGAGHNWVVDIAIRALTLKEYDALEMNGAETIGPEGSDDVSRMYLALCMDSPTPRAPCLDASAVVGVEDIA